MSKSAEREDSFAQQGETRTEAGPWTRETWEWQAEPGPPSPDGSGPRPKAVHELGGILKLAPGGLSAAPIPDVASTSIPLPAVLRYTLEKHDPVVISSRSQTEASGEAKEARSARFGFSPWQWAIGGLALLAGLYGLFRLKGKLGL